MESVLSGVLFLGLLLIQVQWIDGIAVRSGYLFVGVLATLWGGLRIRLPAGNGFRQVGMEVMGWLSYLLAFPAVLYGAVYLLGLYPALAKNATGRWAWSEMLIVSLGAAVFPLARLVLRAGIKWKWARERKLSLAITQTILNVTLLMALLVILLLAAYSVAQSDIAFPEAAGAGPLAVLFNRLDTIFLPMLVRSGGWVLLALLALTPLAALVSYQVARRVTVRLEELVGAVGQLAKGHPEARVVVSGGDEMAYLQRRFNEMAEQLEESRRALEAERDTTLHLLTSRQRWFANISHELRTPLATLKASLEARSGSGDLQDQDVMNGQLLRMQRLLDDLFLLARTDVDQVEISCRPVRVETLLERAAAEFAPYAWQMGGLKLVAQPDQDLPCILVDEQRFLQILGNLLRNAIRHTRPGGMIGLFARCEADEVRVDVRDTGEGIPESDLSDIWEPFYQAEPGCSDGAGLGLALVKELVEQMGGRVGVESEVGEGSCFSVWFPAAASS